MPTHFDTRRPLHPVVGLPREIPITNVQDGRLAPLTREERTWQLRQLDDIPIPDPSDRENYFAGRDLEYWLSGLYAAREMVEACPRLETESGFRVLDFGGATGRVSRHITLLNPAADAWLCDININWIDWMHHYFDRPIKAFQNRSTPHLPLESNSFDFICAFSVFTHLDVEEFPWLLELRRILKPNGILYATVLDDPVWNSLRKPERAWLKKSLLGPQGSPEAEQAIAAQAIPRRYTIQYSGEEAYNNNTFLSRAWIREKWGAFFSELTFDFTKPDAIQSTVVLIK